MHPSHTPAMDKRSITSAINGKKGGRPKELKDFAGDLPGEVWKTLEDFPAYFFSSHGRIISVKRGYPKLRVPQLMPHGHYSIRMARGYKNPSNNLVHRIILEAFKGRCPEGKECSHQDGNGLNNHIDNLERETHQENMDKRPGHGWIFNGEGNHQSRLTEKEVLEIRESYPGKIYGVIVKLAKIYGVHAVTIWDVVHRRTWKHI